MKNYNNSQKLFYELLKVGLWEDQRPVSGIKFHVSTDLNCEKVYQLAQEQSVQGLVLKGIEELKAKGIELGVPKVFLLQWIGEVQQIEQRNKEMNDFLSSLSEKLKAAEEKHE